MAKTIPNSVKPNLSPLETSPNNIFFQSNMRSSDVQVPAFKANLQEIDENDMEDCSVRIEQYDKLGRKESEYVTAENIHLENSQGQQDVTEYINDLTKNNLQFNKTIDSQGIQNMQEPDFLRNMTV